MPSHKVHRLIDKLILGKEYPQVHKFADAILGKGHRKKWGHDVFHVLLLYKITKNINKKDRVNMLISHLMHIAVDNLETELKKKGYNFFDLLDLYIRTKKNHKNRK